MNGIPKALRRLVKMNAFNVPVSSLPQISFACMLVHPVLPHCGTGSELCRAHVKFPSLGNTLTKTLLGINAVTNTKRGESQFCSFSDGQSLRQV